MSQRPRAGDGSVDEAHSIEGDPLRGIPHDATNEVAIESEGRVGKYLQLGMSKTDESRGSGLKSTTSGSGTEVP